LIILAKFFKNTLQLATAANYFVLILLTYFVWHLCKKNHRGMLQMCLLILYIQIGLIWQSVLGHIDWVTGRTYGL